MLITIDGCCIEEEKTKALEPSEIIKKVSGAGQTYATSSSIKEGTHITFAVARCGHICGKVYYPHVVATPYPLFQYRLFQMKEKCCECYPGNIERPIPLLNRLYCSICSVRRKQKMP